MVIRRSLISSNFYYLSTTLVANMNPVLYVNYSPLIRQAKIHSMLSLRLLMIKLETMRLPSIQPCVIFVMEFNSKLAVYTIP